MNQPRGTYNRFRIEEDIWLCEEVLKTDPFNCEHKNVAWLQIVDNLNSIPIFAKPTGERACKHRLDDLLSQYRLQEAAKLKRSGSEEQYQMLWGLLVQIDHLRQISLDEDSTDEKPVLPKPKERALSSKRSFPMSMAQPTDIQQRVQAMQFAISPPAKKQRAHAQPVPLQIAMSPSSSTHSMSHTSFLREPSVSPPLPPLPKLSASSTFSLNHSSSNHDYITLLIQQNKSQLELYERELQQSRKLREKELDLERARLDFEEKKWKQFVEQNQLQHDLLKDVLIQQREAHQALLALLKSPAPEPRQVNGNYGPEDS